MKFKIGDYVAYGDTYGRIIDIREEGEEHELCYITKWITGSFLKGAICFDPVIDYDIVYMKISKDMVMVELL